MPPDSSKASTRNFNRDTVIEAKALTKASRRITQQAIRRGIFRSVRELVEKVDTFVQTSNADAHLFVWTATADSIFAKVQRLCEPISGTAH